MVRKLILSTIVATAAVTNLVAAQDSETLTPTHSDHHYKVLVLRGGDGWQLHRTYRLHAEARRDAIRLWHDGYRVVIWDF
ncbi:hypothetical protein [Frigoriglobus tundricola]|uniref:Uncharacterized protein n=1 Tax=Frigoriglobus tundricola TaxID=2774151 RepID=A0A6M5Z1H0_9BACT|nr:hypothetical protein [Frigoriglobus tundricola]QJX00258.1 hypothetical protein FTUN_7883 [Frigoriglobus tundricola]